MPCPKNRGLPAGPFDLSRKPARGSTPRLGFATSGTEVRFPRVQAHPHRRGGVGGSLVQVRHSGCAALRKHRCAAAAVSSGRVARASHRKTPNGNQVLLPLEGNNKVALSRKTITTRVEPRVSLFRTNCHRLSRPFGSPAQRIDPRGTLPSNLQGFSRAIRVNRG